MGCDIHCYIEYRRKEEPEAKKGHWWNFGEQFHGGRDYHLFGLLAGVRGGDAIFEPRGYPEDAGWATDEDNYSFVYPDDEDPAGQDPGSVTRSTAESWVKSGSSHYKAGSDDKYVSSPDWHNHTWLTLDEWVKVLSMASTDKERDYPLSETYEAMTAAMTALEMAGNEVRVVMWFDN